MSIVLFPLLGPADVVIDAALGAGVCTVACTVVGLEIHNSKFG